MWHDFSRTVKKVASQTLGRTGRGREVHQEIYLRLKDGNTFERIEALKKINAIGKQFFKNGADKILILND